MCKAHSKVTHIKQQKYFHQLKRPGYNTEFLLYPRSFSVPILTSGQNLSTNQISSTSMVYIYQFMADI